MLKRYRFAILVISGLIVAVAGLLARISPESDIEHWFVFAAGLSNMVVLFDLGPMIFHGNYDLSARIWLTMELFFFSLVLGIDFSLAFGRWNILLLVIASIWFIFAVLFMVCSQDYQNKTGFLLSALCLVFSLYLVPWLFRYLTPEWENPLWTLFSNRGYAWIHLLFIPFVYLIVDTKLSKDHPRWLDFIFLDRSLMLAGSACAVSGMLYAFLGPIGKTPPLFESGAAALLLLVGNAWYISIEMSNNAKHTL